MSTSSLDATRRLAMRDEVERLVNALVELRKNQATEIDEIVEKARPLIITATSGESFDSLHMELKIILDDVARLSPALLRRSEHIQAPLRRLMRGEPS
jgi:hypothetical protein